MPKPIPVNDLTWLHLDRPNNLMVVNGVLWFDQEPDWHAVRDVLQERLVGRFPVFGRRADLMDGTWVWQDDPDFDIDNHVRRVTLPTPGDEIAAQDYLAQRFSEPLGRDRPLWTVELISGFTGFGSEHGALILARFHHSLADGVRLVQVILGLLDPIGEDATPGTVGRSRRRRSPARHAARLLTDAAGGGLHIGAGVGSAAVRAPGQALRGGLPRPAHTARLITRPTRVVDALSSHTAVDNLAVNTGRSVGRLALSGRPQQTIWSGTPGVPKKISWVTDLEVDAVRTIGREHGVTINDVCVGLVSRGLSDYLAEKGETQLDELNWLIPVSLKPIDAALPPDLGNHFSVVMAPMPIGVADRSALFGEVHTRMNRIKHSAEPAIVYGIQQLIALTPPAVSTWLTAFVANKTIGVLTNVPGPRTALSLGGQEVRGILGFVPTASDQPIGVAIFSYNGRINIGIVTDAELIPDPERIAAHVRAEYDNAIAGQRSADTAGDAAELPMSA